MYRPAPGGAFEGLRVIDLAQVRSGPTCVKQFADFGADVIRIEPPPGSGRAELMTGPRDGADMQNLHRNKRLLTLELKSAQGREVLHRLVRSADVVVENYRPDVKTRLGIDYETLAAINPRIILASISGFGQDGPYRERPGFDQILQGMSGLMSVTGRPGEGPMRTGAAIVDVATGLYAALGVMTALHERTRSGRGQWVQASLLQSGIGLMDFQAARWLVDGVVPGQVGNDHPTSMPTSAYPTSDGHMNVGAGGDAIWRRLCEAIGQPELAEDARFALDADRSKHRQALKRVRKCVDFGLADQRLRPVPINRRLRQQFTTQPQVRVVRCRPPGEHDIKLVQRQLGEQLLHFAFMAEQPQRCGVEYRCQQGMDCQLGNSV